MYIKKNIPPGPKRRPIMDRFMEKVTIPKCKTHCWKWMGKKDRKGYGLMYAYRDNGKSFSTGAHRLAWSLFRGPIPNGKIVCHHCDVPDCVNPAHLFLGTFKDNVDDMDRKGRRKPGGAPGELNAQCKINTDVVKNIRADYESGKYSQEQIAGFYGLGQTHVSRIIRGESWKHISGGGGG